MNTIKIISHTDIFPDSSRDNTSIKKITYTYDSMNRRVARTDKNGTYQYLYGNPNHPFQITAVRDPSGNLSVYHYDDFGLLFAIESDATWHYVTTDQLGMPQVVCDADGEVVKVLQYDSFGKQIADSNPAFELHISFAGGLADCDTELVRFGFRDYDSVSGKWTAKDPIGFAGGDGNLYGYVGNSSITFFDPYGLNPKCHPGPSGVSIDENIQQAENHRGLLPASIFDLDNLRWFYNQVRNKGPWDYKQKGRDFEYFGNFNFGATGAAMGYPLDFLLRGAGWAQTRAGTSMPEWGHYYWGIGKYGDDPNDVLAIKAGYSYYHNTYKPAHKP